MATKTKQNWLARPMIYLGEDLRAKADAFGEKHGLSISQQVREALPFWYAAIKDGTATLPAKEDVEKKAAKANASRHDKLAKPPKNEARPLGTKKEKKAKAAKKTKAPKAAKPAKAAKSAKPKKEAKADATAGLMFPKKSSKVHTPKPHADSLPPATTDALADAVSTL